MESKEPSETTREASAASRSRIVATIRCASRRFRLSPVAGGLVLGIIVFIELWAAFASDPDFWLPDPFRWVTIALAALFLFAGFLPRAWMRFSVRLSLGVIPALMFMGMEAAGRFGQGEGGESRIVLTPDDTLLRYHYRPGSMLNDKDRHGNRLVITEDGLWDTPKAIAKPANTYRVVVLGDSVPNDGSISFPNRFPQLLEGKLTAMAGGRDVEVINVSCEGYNSIQEVRLFELVGLKYEPDLVVLAYVLNDPFLQNGGYRRIGNSFAAWRLAPFALNVMGKNSCSMLKKLHSGYSFDLVVRASMERLSLLSQLHQFDSVVALLPLIEPFDDPDCGYCYDRVEEVARDSGFPVLRLVDELKGQDHRRYLKPENTSDVTHPNSMGHVFMAESIARFILPYLAAETVAFPP